MKYFLQILLLSTIFFIGCNQPPTRKITLREWLSEKKESARIENKLSEKEECFSLEGAVSKLKIEEFKKPFYNDIARCYYRNGELNKAKIFLFKYFLAGAHISWIDSTNFQLIFSEIKSNYPVLHERFWQKKDTGYFSKIERMANLDQALVGNTEKRHQVFAKHSDYLLNYSQEKGFPWQPLSPNYFKKEKFRIRIAPGMIAIHAPVKEKIILRKYAIESAEQEKNSWLIPIGIGLTFFTQLSRDAVKPIRFIYFDKKEKMKEEKSYLQLYCIKEFMQSNNISKIKIHPSKANSLNKKTIRNQLEQIKNSMIKEFDISANSIEISEIPDSNEEIGMQELGGFNYTFTNYF